jgi:hypothetical protein
MKRVILAAIGATLGLACVLGAIVLIWGSQDAMLVLIHWIGEERALGPQSVIRNPDGSTLLTNPSAMARWMMPIWAVGFAQVVAGLHLLWSSVKRWRNRGKRAF